MPKPSVTFRTGAILLALLLVAAACSSGQNETTEATAGATEPGETEPDATEPDTTEPGATRDDLAALEHGVGDSLYPTAGAAGLDVTHYDLAIDTSGGSFSGVATLDVTIENPQQDILSFDLVGLTVTSVVLNGAAADFGQSDIELNIAHDGSDSATIVIDYAGTPQPLDAGIRLSYVGWQAKSWGSFVVSEPTGAPTWFPVNDHPTDKATFTLSVTVDDGDVVVGPGSDVGNEGNTYTFAPADPMAPYLMSAAIGDFDVVETAGASGVPVRAATHSSMEPPLIDIDPMIVAIQDMFGDYPFESYGYVAVPEELGFALENQTLSLFDLTTYRSSQTHAHELAHQWFGNHLSPADWTDIWLNEGFATWVDVWWESGGDPAAFDVLATNVPDNALGPLLIEDTERLFSTTVYVRGGLLLEALRRTIGQDEFEALLQEWLGRYGGGTASTGDFVSLVGELHGVGAAALMTEWVEAPIPPDLPAA